MDETSAAGDAGRDASLPLRGLLVVALEQAVAAPFASRQLADLQNLAPGAAARLGLARTRSGTGTRR